MTSPYRDAYAHAGPHLLRALAQPTDGGRFADRPLPPVIKAPERSCRYQVKGKLRCDQQTAEWVVRMLTYIASAYQYVLLRLPHDMPDNMKAAADVMRSVIGCIGTWMGSKESIHRNCGSVLCPICRFGSVAYFMSGVYDQAEWFRVFDISLVEYHAIGDIKWSSRYQAPRGTIGTLRIPLVGVENMRPKIIVRHYALFAEKATKTAALTMGGIEGLVEFSGVPLGFLRQCVCPTPYSAEVAVQVAHALRAFRIGTLTQKSAPPGCGSWIKKTIRDFSNMPTPQNTTA